MVPGWEQDGEPTGGSPTGLGERTTLVLGSSAEHPGSHFCHSAPNAHIPMKPSPPCFWKHKENVHYLEKLLAAVAFFSERLHRLTGSWESQSWWLREQDSPQGSDMRGLKMPWKTPSMQKGSVRFNSSRCLCRGRLAQQLNIKTSQIFRLTSKQKPLFPSAIK